MGAVSRWILILSILAISVVPAAAQVGVVIMAREPGEARELLQRARQFRAATKRHLADGTSPDALRSRVENRAHELHSEARRILENSKQKYNLGYFEGQDLRRDLGLVLKICKSAIASVSPAPVPQTELAGIVAAPRVQRPK